MYDFRLPLWTTIAFVAIGALAAGESSAFDKSLQFEAAFQGELLAAICDVRRNGNKIDWHRLDDS